MALRLREMAKAKREFKARGSKVIRCQSCLLPVRACICEDKPKAFAGSAFCFIMYRGEVYKPSNTGRLVADIMQDNYAFRWDRTEPDPQLLALLQDPKYRPIVIFPHQYAEAPRCIHSPSELDDGDTDKQNLFIMLDGTWREAKKMFRSSYLQALPVLGLSPEVKPHYQLRESVHPFQLCTVEVARLVLDLNGEAEAASALGAYFDLFKRHYIAGKPHMVYLENDATSPL